MLLIYNEDQVSIAKLCICQFLKLQIELNVFCQVKSTKINFKNVLELPKFLSVDLYNISLIFLWHVTKNFKQISMAATVTIAGFWVTRLRDP